MDLQARLYLWTAIIIAAVAGLLVLMWPHRRFREFDIRRSIAAPAEDIWELVQANPENPRNAAFNDTVVGHRIVSTDPEVAEITFDSSGRHGTHLTTVRMETLEARPPKFMAARCLSVDGRPFPFGLQHVTEIQLFEDAGTSTVTMKWRGEIVNSLQLWLMGRKSTQYMDALKVFCETGQGTAMRASKWSPMKSIGLTAAAFASFSFLFGWIFALLLSVAIGIHEFGHWLAMRMTGQPKPRIMLVPFFGGAAVPNHPHKTQFDRAFVALAGAGLSLIPCIALLWVAASLGLPDGSDRFRFSSIKVQSGPNGASVLFIAYFVALLNGLQLIPVLPLDGGHVLRSVIESFNTRHARPILLAIAGIAIVGFAWLEEYMLVALLLLGAMQAWYIGKHAPAMRPMGSVGLATIGVSYLAILAIYIGTVIFASQTLGYHFF